MTARQGLTVVGQIVGAYVTGGSAWGAAIGGAIGGFIGGEIDGPQKGPRLDDTTSPAIEFGAKCPRVYGRVWCTLSPLWWSGLRESTVNSGGKGAADSTTDQFVYHCDMLGRLADGANVIAWTRIRIDGKIVGTQLASSSPESLNATATTDKWSDVELFSGGPTQTPWSVYEAAVGAGNASAFRDQCTFAFTNLLMPNGRNPSLIEVEVVTAATYAPPNVQLRVDFEDGTADDTSYFNQTPNLSGAMVVDAGGVTTDLGVTDAQLTYSSATLAASNATGFTIEARVSVPSYLASSSVNNVFLDYSFESGPVYEFTGYDPDMDFNTPFEFGIYSNETGNRVNVATGNYGDYNHVAIVRPPGTNPTARVYVNGALVYTFTADSIPGSTGGSVTVRRAANIFDGVRQFKVDNIRLMRGEAYTGSSFTPPDVLAPADQPNVIPGTEDLQDVLEAEMLRCTPLTSANIDMSAAAGKEVWGFKASRSAAAECGVLLDWYYLDIFCGDKITVVERGGASEQTIPYGYTGAGRESAGDPFAGLTRGADVESQFATAVQYINILADGEVDTQQGQRVGTGSEVRAVNFSIYSKPTLAKGRADTITQDTRVAAHTATVHLGARQAVSVQPASVLTLVDNKGNTYRTRVLRMVWNQGVYDVDVCLDDPNILKTVGIAVDVDTSVIEVTPPAVAEFLPLDIPRVSDAQNASGYLGLVKTNDATSARWFDSPDDLTYTARVDFANDAVFGRVTAASGAFDQGVLFDEGSSLTVAVGDGELSSATRDAMLADRGLNAFAVGIAGRMVLGQFRTATLVSAGVYTLTGFVNMGANGTEQYCASIAAGDDFAMLGIHGTAHIPRSLSDLGVPFFVKAVAFGASLDNVTAVDFAANGVNLKPLSPVLLRADRDSSSGDLAISWTRRTRGDTRFGGPLGDACPLFEATEMYHVRLYTDGTFATLLRDFGTVTSPSVPYAAADRIADGLGLYDPLYVDVTMVSDVVGEGYPLQDAA